MDLEDAFDFGDDVEVGADVGVDGGDLGLAGRAVDVGALQLCYLLNHHEIGPITTMSRVRFRELCHKSRRDCRKGSALLQLSNAVSSGIWRFLWLSPRRSRVAHVVRL
jgi:hypothetical protein